MQQNAYMILLVEDDAADAALLRELLDEERAETGIRFDMETATNLEAGLQRLAAGGIDLIFLDLRLPDSQGSETFSSVQRKFSEIPIVVLSETDDENTIDKVLSEGASEFLRKRDLDSVETQRILDRFFLQHGKDI